MNILLICNRSRLNQTHQLIKTCYPGDLITSFSSVSGAIHHIENSQTLPDICFIEILMQDASGFRFVEHLRRRNKRAKVVLIAPDDRFALEGWRYGMNDYLIEPLSLDSIRHTLISCAP